MNIEKGFPATECGRPESDRIASKPLVVTESHVAAKAKLIGINVRLHLQGSHTHRRLDKSKV